MSAILRFSFPSHPRARRGEGLDCRIRVAASEDDLCVIHRQWLEDQEEEEVFYTVHYQGKSWHVEDGNTHRVIARCPTKGDADTVVNGLVALEELKDVVRVSGVGLKNLLSIATETATP